ncbi:hypothetical protein V6N12_019787 [Hibiscus sabdariffa]|uniref:Uncharacterized protein n=1 Tax=Hibiscus sabdariffa TaxID=183260 RepID=A0ABR2AZJ8_9ROSI
MSLCQFHSSTAARSQRKRTTGQDKETSFRGVRKRSFLLERRLCHPQLPGLDGVASPPESCSRRDIQSAAAKAALYERSVKDDEGPECMAWWDENGMAAFEEERAGALRIPMRLDSMEGELWSFMEDDLDFLTSCSQF